MRGWVVLAARLPARSLATKCPQHLLALPPSTQRSPPVLYPKILESGACHQPRQGLNHEPPAPLRRAQGEHQEGGALCSGKTGRTGLQTVRYFRRFYVPNSCISSYLGKHYNPSWCCLLLVTFRRSATNFCKMCVRCMQLPSP